MLQRRKEIFTTHRKGKKEGKKERKKVLISLPISPLGEKSPENK